MFDRYPCLNGTQIIDYVVNDTITWAAVIGIKLSDEVMILNKRMYKFF